MHPRTSRTSFSPTPAGLLDARHSPWTRDSYLTLITEGGFPEALGIRSAAVRRSWFSGYLSTVIVRDVGGFASVRKVEAIPQALALVAARSGSTLVVTDIARDMAVSPGAARNHLTYMETVFLTVTVPAWSTNLTAKIIKTPKACVADCGLASHLLRATPDALRAPGHPALGGLLETFVLSELSKLRVTSKEDYAIYHLRARSGPEVDFVIEGPDGKIAGLEVKASASPSGSDAKHLRWLRGKPGDRMIAGAVLQESAYAGSAVPADCGVGRFRLATARPAITQATDSPADAARAGR